MRIESSVDDGFKIIKGFSNYEKPFFIFVSSSFYQLVDRL
jgi:hypothetical protein